VVPVAIKASTVAPVSAEHRTVERRAEHPIFPMSASLRDTPTWSHERDASRVHRIDQ
jgi:hypothetical protein